MSFARFPTGIYSDGPLNPYLYDNAIILAGAYFGLAEHFLITNVLWYAQGNMFSR